MNDNIYIIKISIKINYSKISNGLIIRVIIFIKSFKFKFSIFNKFKKNLILNL